jgi:hypothetical protein
MTGCSDLSKVQSLAGALYAPAVQNGVASELAFSIPRVGLMRMGILSQTTNITGELGRVDDGDKGVVYYPRTDDGRRSAPSYT